MLYDLEKASNELQIQEKKHRGLIMTKTGGKFWALEYALKCEEKKAAARNSYNANPEAKRQQKERDSYKANPEAKMQKKRDSYKANPEAKKQKERDSYKANPEGKKQYGKDNYDKNKEQGKSTMQKYYRQNLSHLLLAAYYSTSGLSKRAATSVYYSASL